MSSAVALTPKQIASYIMRTTGPEQFYSQAFGINQPITVPKNIPLDSPLADIFIRIKGRLTVTTTFANLPPEAPQNLLQSVRLVGTHKVLGSLVPIQMSGATLFALNRVFGLRGNSIIINGVRLPELNKPMGLGNAFFTVAGSPYDFSIIWRIPVYPYNVGDGRAIQYLLNADMWGQSLQLQLATADLTAFGNGAGGSGVGTLSGFGSASGSPSLDVLLNYASLGKLAPAIAQAVCVRNVFGINSILQANANNQRLVLLQNQRTMNVVTKTGTILANTTAGVTVFGTLSDQITEQTILRVNNNPIRNLQYDDVTGEFYGSRANGVQPTGYKNISFVDGFPASHDQTAMKGDMLSPGAQFDIATNVVAANAANGGEVIQDMIYGEPVIAGQS